MKSLVTSVRILFIPYCACSVMRDNVRMKHGEVAVSSLCRELVANAPSRCNRDAPILPRRPVRHARARARACTHTAAHRHAHAHAYTVARARPPTVRLPELCPRSFPLFILLPRRSRRAAARCGRRSGTIRCYRASATRPLFPRCGVHH